MKILITGGTGFIGRHLVRKLRKEHELFALARAAAPPDSNARWIEHDLTAALDYSRLPKQVDAIIHLAQSEFYKDFPARADDVYRLNVGATFELLEYARRAGAKHFVLASTGGVYGYGCRPFVETDPVQLAGFYFTSKHIAELLVRDYQPFFDTVVARLFFVYGVGQKPHMFIPRLIRNVMRGEAITLDGPEGIRTNPTHIVDAVDGLAATLNLSGHHVINIAGPQALSLREIGQAIAAEVGREPLFTVREEQAPGNLIGDVTKARALLGVPRVRFSEGIAEVCRELTQRT
jgi:nucleoside-diphosphate-sugar epimerase